MTKLTDTSPDVARMVVEIYRRMPLDQKWQQLRQLCRRGRSLHAAGERARNPGATDSDILVAWFRDRLRIAISDLPLINAKESVMTPPDDLHVVLDVFRKLDIAYALGGSMASSLHGENRDTYDADITVEPFKGKEQLLVAALDPPYFVQLQTVRQALANRSSFNILSPSGFKVDVFVRKDRPFEVSALRRRSPHEFSEAPGRPVDVLSPEDTILFKLEWYRLGGEVSERQWNDIVNVMRIQGQRLDQGYLDKWATDLGVKDLVARARQESVTP